jgi:hypothetical protein
MKEVRGANRICRQYVDSQVSWNFLKSELKEQGNERRSELLKAGPGSYVCTVRRDGLTL